MLMNYLKYLKAFTSNKKGQGMVEYGLIVALIAVAVIGVITLLGTEISNLFQQVVDTLNPPTST